MPPYKLRVTPSAILSQGSIGPKGPCPFVASQEHGGLAWKARIDGERKTDASSSMPVTGLVHRSTSSARVLECATGGRGRVISRSSNGPTTTTAGDIGNATIWVEFVQRLNPVMPLSIREEST